MSRSIFTPYVIIVKERQQKLALMFVLILSPLIFFNLSTFVSATETITYDFSADPITIPVTASTSDSNISDFRIGNNLPVPSAMTAFLPTGGVAINQGSSYTTFSSPEIGSSEVRHTFFQNNILYVSTAEGLSVIDTKSTFDTSDDELVTRYHTGSVPALANNYVYISFLDGNLLYVATGGGGLHVIDTQGTVSAADDTLVTRYHTGSAPALASNTVFHSFKDGALVYIGTTAGLHVIDTQGTVSAADDTLVTRYHTGVASTPRLSSNQTFHSYIVNGLLYVTTSTAGLHVINTQGTVSAADDTLVTRYHTGSTPALAVNTSRSAFMSGNILYVSTTAGLHVIDTQGTVSAVDDTLVTRYDRESIPALEDSFVTQAFLEDELLYISTTAGLHVINTQGTVSAVDDTLVTRYHTESSAALLQNFLYNTNLSDGNLYLATLGGVAVIRPNFYNTTGIYYGSPRLIDTTPITGIGAVTQILSNQTVTLSYRTGTTTAVWRDDFNTLDNLAGDFYGYGGTNDWQTIEVQDGVLRSSGNPLADPDYAIFIIQTGFPANYFESGSVISVRYRVLNKSADMTLNLVADEYEVQAFSNVQSEEWTTASLIAGSDFSHVLFELYTLNGEPLDPAVLEIDYLQITTPDSMGEWGSWNVCADSSKCTLENLDDNPWLQYRLELETDNTNSSPSVTEVVFEGPYQSSYTFTSDTTTFTSQRRLTEFVPDVTTPASTTIQYEYSVDGGATFTVFDPAQFEDLKLVTNSFTWRATLGTSNGALTPTITQVSLSHGSAEDNSNGSRVTETSEQINAMRDITSPAAQAVLKEQYPEYFKNPDAPLAREKAMVVLLGEIIRLMKELALLREEEQG
jgi:hypothetical protein